MLKLKHITKEYHVGDITVDALKGIDLEFRKSEFVAILGPSGCGKTTLLNIIGGLDRYTDGDLIIDDVSTEEYRDADWDIYRNNSIGFVFQSYNLIPHQTVLKNVELAMTLAGVSTSERKNRATEALEKVGLGDQLKKRPNQLSGGQMQRVAIARALVNNPDILLADEPTGALDSETSVQVMEILKEISKERLIIMVTHNPELAEEYSTRTIKLSDGLVTSDSKPYDSGIVPPREKQKKKKISMSFLTAITLSFSNLLTKKGRTIMTAIAGSIGIVGIALILSLANGVNNYIENVEEDMLSIYPLTIQNQGMDISSMLVASQTAADDDDDSDSDGDGDNKDSSTQDKKIDEITMLSDMFSNVGTNDLESLKKFLDSRQSGVRKNVNAIQYSYNVTPQIYSEDTSNGVKKINPNESFSSLGFGSTESSSSLLNMSMSMDTFYELADDTNLFKGQYDVVAGDWPENYDECLLVLTQNGSIPDLLMYQLGFRDDDELEDMLKQFANGEDVDTPNNKLEVGYDEIMSKNLKIVPNSEYYKYDKEYKVWEDMSKNDKYMKKKVKAGEDLKIVGIVQPSGDSTTNSLQTGIYYTSDLTRHLMDEAAKSKIVKKQLAKSKINVFTGKTFSEEKDDESGSDMDLASLINIDQTKIQSAFSIDESKLNLDMEKYLDMSDMDMSKLGDTSSMDLSDVDLSDVDLTSAIDMTKAMTVMEEIVQGYISSGTGKSFSEYLAQPSVQQKLQTGLQGAVNSSKLEKELGSVMGDYIESMMKEYMKEITDAITEQIQTGMEKAMKDLATAIPAAMSIDENKFAEAFQFNMDEEELQSLMMTLLSPEETTYDNNMVKLGYAEEEDPYSISIYPKDFHTKQNVINIIDNYNKRMEKAGDEDKVIVYTDLVGTLMSSLNEIVDLISYVLIAFVSISLVVSSIMIGIITYISVLERKKEIGILRSIGASKHDISRVFNAETLIIGFSAGVIAIISTLIIDAIASAIVYNQLDVANIAILPPIAGVILIAISMFLTFIAGLIPSKAAARKDPVEALRSE